MQLKNTLITLALALHSAGAFAQDLPAVILPEAEDSTKLVPAITRPANASKILTLDQDRLFRNSAWGQMRLATIEAQAVALSAQNREIDAQLEKRERELTALRAKMRPADFAPLATEFDQYVETQRSSQEGKSRDLARELEETRQRFFYEIRPVLVELMLKDGALVILSEASVFLALESVDITDDAIEMINQRLPGYTEIPDLPTTTPPLSTAPEAQEPQ